MFGLVLIGYLAGSFDWITDAGVEGLTSFVFKIAIPVMLFYRIALTELPDQIPWDFMLAYYSTTLALFGLCLGIGRFLRLSGQEASIFAMSGSYSNVVLLGIPLVLASLGDAATVPLFVIVSTHAGIMFLVTTLSLETSNGESQPIHKLFSQTFFVLAKNQIVVGLVVGLCCNLLMIQLPVVIDKTASYLASAALPCAVFSIGATISRYKITGDIAKISTLVLIKNILHPVAIWLVCAWVFQLNHLWTAVAVILACCPTGINVYIFANKYQVQASSTATVIVLTTAISIPVLGLALFLLLN